MGLRLLLISLNYYSHFSLSKKEIMSFFFFLGALSRFKTSDVNIRLISIILHS